MQLFTGISGGKPPLHLNLMGIAPLLPGVMTSRTRCIEGRRCARHRRASTESSISAMFNQLPCFGV